MFNSETYADFRLSHSRIDLSIANGSTRTTRPESKKPAVRSIAGWRWSDLTRAVRALCANPLTDAADASCTRPTSASVDTCTVDASLFAGILATRDARTITITDFTGALVTSRDTLTRDADLTLSCVATFAVTTNVGAGAGRRATPVDASLTCVDSATEAVLEPDETADIAGLTHSYTFARDAGFATSAI